MPTRRAGSGWRRLAFLATDGVEVAAQAGAASDAAKYRRVEGDDDQHGRHDGTDDHERHVEDDVDVSHLREDVAVRQRAARMAVHDADGEGSEAGEGEACDGLG